ncbi:potassium channel family protein [Streptomyces bambusae]|uniref:Two pore domain potassium channel family protein n=1 Tax=Streptomyces bambusae TaxID=1550616 RepID=A0ABS6ZD90_9ACTN|nr:potassium channel family protein [Streptomyces bambusae]MBW5485719.1 two pore domain potassium channel family protein [Streptomyces bambusae]
MDRDASPVGEEPEGGGARRRLVAAALLRSFSSVVLLTVVYYLVPLEHGVGAVTVISLMSALALFGWMVFRQTVEIARSDHPVLRAVEALCTAVPFFLLTFAITYVLLSANAPQSFSEPLSRTDSLYFTVTVFATVGFGDIVPTTETGRVLTTVQMVADLVVVGVVAKVFFSAVRIGMRRQGGQPYRLPDDEPP